MGFKVHQEEITDNLVVETWQGSSSGKVYIDFELQVRESLDTNQLLEINALFASIVRMNLDKEQLEKIIKGNKNEKENTD